MTILSDVKAALGKDAVAPDNMAQLLSMSHEDLNSDELDVAKTKFSKEFAAVEKEKAVPKVDVPAIKEIKEVAAPAEAIKETEVAVPVLDAPKEEVAAVVAAPKKK